MTTADIFTRAQELADELLRLNDLYYRDGSSPVPDAEYDALRDELAALLAEHPELEPAKNPIGTVGAPAVLQGPTVRHARPMLSLSKATTDEQILAFCARFSGQAFRVSEKLDGLSLSIVYGAGTLDYAATRGTGEVGEVVTDQVRWVIPNVPTHLPSGPAGIGRLELRGEAVMTRTVWAAYNTSPAGRPLTNPRNGAAGTLMHKDPRACASAGRTLRFVCFDMDHNVGEATFEDLARGGVSVSEQHLCHSADEVLDAIARIGERRDSLDYDIDGAVIRLHDEAAYTAAGFNSDQPRGAIAFKYPPEERSAKLLSVEWPVGKIGRVPPRARIERVFVGGVWVENVTLHNPRLIRERDLRIGDTVRVMRRGDVIPFISSSISEDRDGTEQEVVPPTHCPSCEAELIVKGTGEERWCENLQCPAQAARRLMHFASRAAADMDGVGDVWIEKLAEDGVLRTPSDFYALTAEQLTGYERMGARSAAKMVASVAQSKGLGLRRAIIALAIPLASEGTAKRLCQAGYISLEQVAAAAAGELEQITDIGPKVAQSLVDFFARPEIAAEVLTLRAHGVNLDVLAEDAPVDASAAAASPLKDRTVVVTGAIVNPATGEKVTRPDFVRLVEQAGATNANSVSASTDMLICGQNVGASKTGKAEKLGVQVVDQADAWAWLRAAGVVAD